MLVKFALLSLLISSAGFAQEHSPYSFGGACAAQGVWTQTALSAAQNLRKVTLQLKDDANCKAMGNTVIASIESLEKNLSSASDTPKRLSRLSEIPQEVSALRSFAISNPDIKSQVLRLMMNKSMEGATLSAQVATEANPASMDVTGMANGMSDFGARLQNTTRTGLSMLNQVLDVVPQLNQCLTGDGQQALGSFFSSAVQMASSFASSGQDMTGSQMATTIAKLSNLVREKKYTNILRKLNQQEFMTSMSCLMEVTSESYCQARDGMRLFQNGMKDLQFRQDQKGQLTANNPFVGYYVLNTHVPNITKWMQKVQIGVDPKLPTDALYQNKIQQEVTDFYKGVKTLLGDYNQSVATINTLQDPQAKKQQLYHLIMKIAGSMTTGGGTGYSDDGEKVNFFLMSKNAQNIPFELIGLPVPDEVTGRKMPKLTPDEWFQGFMNDPSLMPGFKDVNSMAALTDTIGHKMQEIIRSANVSAIEYYNKWYIVDKAALVNESTIDINYTVQDSLKAIYQYLDQEKVRIKKYNGDPSILPTIVDTQIRIKKIMDAYQGLRTLGKKIQDGPLGGLNQTVEEVQAVTDQYESLIKIVFEEFNVMQSRSGFLANRMVNFVYADYILMLNNRVDFTAYQQDLFNATGMAAMDRMLQLYNGNPSNVQTDLLLALRINKGNIDALDMLLKDNVINTIAQLDAIKNGRTNTGLNSVKRLVTDQYIDDHKDTGSILSTVLKSIPYSNILLLPSRTMAYWFQHSDRYPLGGLITSQDDENNRDSNSEFKDADGVQAQLCIQALAFNDQTPLVSLCHGTVLLSPMAATAKDGMSVSYDEKLQGHMQDKVDDSMKKSLNRTDRICAFRDYNIRNMAKMMSLRSAQMPSQSSQ